MPEPLIELFKPKQRQKQGLDSKKSAPPTINLKTRRQGVATKDSRKQLKLHKNDFELVRKHYMLANHGEQERSSTVSTNQNLLRHRHSTPCGAAQTSISIVDGSLERLSLFLHYAFFALCVFCIMRFLHYARKKRGSKNDSSPTRATKTQRVHRKRNATLQSSTQSRTHRPNQPPERHGPNPATSAAGADSLQHRTQSEPAQTRGRQIIYRNILARESAEKPRNS